MMKARATRKDGTPLFVFGLSDGNCQQLLADKPIVFHGSAVNFPEYWFLIGRGRPPAIPAALFGRDAIVLGIKDKKLRGQVAEPKLLLTLDNEALKIIVFRHTDEQAMYDYMQEFMGEDTQVTATGFPRGRTVGPRLN